VEKGNNAGEQKAYFDLFYGGQPEDLARRLENSQDLLTKLSI